MLKNFKAIITTNKDAQVGQNQQKAVVNLPFELEITIDKNNQIHDIQPRTFFGVDLFSKYHGRTMDWCSDLVREMRELNESNINGQTV